MSKQTKTAAGMKKREQIDAAQRTVFIWAVIAAVAISLCAVVGYFLVKEIIFTQKIYNEKSATIRTLNDNIVAAEQLEKNIQALIANGDLAKVKANSSDTNYKVVLDALPVTNDSTVLGSSLLQEILPLSRVEVESLSADTVADDAAPAMDATGAPIVATDMGSVTAIPFQFEVTGTYQEIEKMFKDIERSIRPINVKNVTIDALQNSLTVTVQGESYFSSEKSVQLTEKQVTP